MTTAENGTCRGLDLFSFGFRPFFLSGAAWAGLAVPIWVLAYLYGGGTVLGVPGRDWHVHEMLFGYLAAVIAGFLLTAVPNWTGRPPVTGLVLVALFGLWVAGRIAMLMQAPLGMLAAVIDAMFLLVFAAVIWREITAARNWRNLPVCAMVSLFAVANVGLHLSDESPALASLCERLALAGPAMLVALIGGRIIPNFTRNWLVQHNARTEPAAFGRLDLAVLVTTGVALLAWICAPDLQATGVLLAAAGIANFGRLARWRGVRTGSEALVWVLHAGYAWLAAALLLIGLSTLAPAMVPRSTGVHTLTAGAFGVMTLAVMTRTSLGHTGRPLAADRKTTLIYLTVNAAALARVLAPMVTMLQPALLEASAVLWSLAFLGFAVAYGPMLLSPRVAN